MQTCRLILRGHEAALKALAVARVAAEDHARDPVCDRCEGKRWILPPAPPPLSPPLPPSPPAREEGPREEEEEEEEGPALLPPAALLSPREQSELLVIDRARVDQIFEADTDAVVHAQLEAKLEAKLKKENDKELQQAASARYVEAAYKEMRVPVKTVTRQPEGWAREKAASAAAERLTHLRRKESAMLRGACRDWKAGAAQHGPCKESAAQAPILSVPVSPLVTAAATSGQPAQARARSCLAFAFAFFMNATLFFLDSVLTRVLQARSCLAIAFAFILKAVLFLNSVLLFCVSLPSLRDGEGALLLGPPCLSLFMDSR